MKHYTYTVIVDGITPEEAKRTEVHLTWGQEWRERVRDAYDVDGRTAVIFETIADFTEYNSPVNASVGINQYRGIPEIDLRLEIDNDRYNKPKGAP